MSIAIKDPQLLPYGVFVTSDSSVLHDRKYRPLVRVAGRWPHHDPATATVCDPVEWIKHDEKIYLYTDAASPRRDRKTRAHLQNLIESIPALGDEIKRRDDAALAAEKAEWNDHTKYSRIASLSPASQAKLREWQTARENVEYEQQSSGISMPIIPFPTPAAPPAPAPTPALHLTFFDECRERAPKHWILKGVFAKGENSSIFGAPGTLKSAFLVDAAIHVASGMDWRGFKSKERCGVVYFAFERADQVRRRLSAYAVRDGVSDLPISVAGQIVDMLNPGCVDIIVATIRAAEARFGIPVGFIVFDTWSKGIAAGGGDEDKARDQNVIAANLRRIHEHVSVHIAGVGHSGKDESRGERGSNARQGDVDLQIQITGDITKTATVIKANDQPEGPLTSFAGEVIALDTDEDGEPVTAFILSTRICTAVAPTSKLSDRQVLALDALRRAIKDHGKRAEGMKAVEVDHWREELFRSGVIERDASNPRADFKRLRDGLARSKRIVEQDGLVRMGYAAPVTPPAMLPPLPPGQ